MLRLDSKASLEAEFLLFGEPQSFSLEASSAWMRPRYGGSSALLRVYGQNVCVSKILSQHLDW